MRDHAVTAVGGTQLVRPPETDVESRPSPLQSVCRDAIEPESAIAPRANDQPLDVLEAAIVGHELDPEPDSRCSNPAIGLVNLLSQSLALRFT